MTPKQQLFVDEYLIDLNATQAAIRAGYSVKTARQIGEENLSKPDIAAAVQVAMDKRSERTEITADYVLQSIVSTMERCKQAEPVFNRKGEHVEVETPDGGMAKAYTFNAMGVLKGAELLGKHLKLFTEKVQLSSDPDEPLIFRRIDASGEPTTRADD
jgi:phage terminase small subunit